MGENTKEIENLDGIDTQVLNRKGWHYLTYYKTTEGNDGSSAYDKAIERALKHERKVGIRTVVKENSTHYELWDKW